MTFMEISDRLNILFPPTTDFDYRDLVPEKLWRKVYDFIEKIGLLSKYTDEELIEIRKIITSEQKNNYHKKAVIKNNVVSNAEYSYEKNGVDVRQNIYGFDQNNYVIKQSVLRMKECVFTSILKKSRLRLDLITDEFDDMYNRNMGSLQDIKKHSYEEEIELYLVKLLTVSKEDNDFYRFKVDLFVRNVLLNFGFYPKSNYLTNFINTITNKIEGILFSDSNYVEDKKDTRYIDSSKLNQKSIKELAECISTMMIKCLKKRQDEEFTIAPSEPKNERISKRVGHIVDYQKQIEEQQRLLDRNKKIVAELCRLREKKNRLEKELEENTAKMASM